MRSEPLREPLRESLREPRALFEPPVSPVPAAYSPNDDRGNVPKWGMGSSARQGLAAANEATFERAAPGKSRPGKPNSHSQCLAGPIGGRILICRESPIV